MAKVTDRYAEQVGQRGGERGLVFICDFSPPRGADRSVLERIKDLDADFISVAYSPGKSVRVDSAILAYVIKQEAGKDVLFNLGTRDMNRLALQSHLLGAQMLGLENLLVVRGDEFTERERGMLKSIEDIRPTELVAAITAMNEGTDFKGLKLRIPTSFCIGASIDLGRPMEAEARLTQSKVAAGAHFLISQALYKAAQVEEFHNVYQRVMGQEVALPVFYGLPILEKESLAFGDVPVQVQRDLDQGRSGIDIALEQLHAFIGIGVRSVYLVPPILRGGLRNYEAAQQFLQEARRL